MTFIPIHSVAQLTERVRDARQHNTPVYPYAGNTQQHQLAPARQTGLSLNLTGLNQLIDYPHQDLTITVLAGMTISTLQKHLVVHQQTLPIDVPQASQATVGGSIAANINGPRRTGWGTWRDYLIGLSWINDQGQECKAGGRVVKNVAGYDFCKLFTGSFGTLGIITQVTLKVKPLPESFKLLTATITSSELNSFCELIRQSRLRPTIFIMQPTCEPGVVIPRSCEPGGVSPRSEPAKTWSLHLAFEDNHIAVAWQTEHLHEITKNVLKDPTVTQGMEATQVLTKLTNFTATGENLTYQATIPTSRCMEFATEAQQMTSSLQAQPAIGFVTGHLPPQSSIEEAQNAVTQLRTLASSMGGHLTLPRCPSSWRRTLHPFGPPRPDWPLMRKVKQAMDVNNIFQRGRHEILKTDN